MFWRTTSGKSTFGRNDRNSSPVRCPPSPVPTVPQRACSQAFHSPFPCPHSPSESLLAGLLLSLPVSPQSLRELARRSFTLPSRVPTVPQRACSQAFYSPFPCPHSPSESLLAGLLLSLPVSPQSLRELARRPFTLPSRVPTVPQRACSQAFYSPFPCPHSPSESLLAGERGSSVSVT